MAELNGKNGVWRTVGGRRIFIRDGEDLASAMKKSGKFKNKKIKPYSKEDYEERDRRLQKRVDEGLITKEDAEYEKARLAWQRDEITREEFDRIREKLEEKTGEDTKGNFDRQDLTLSSSNGTSQNIANLVSSSSGGRKEAQEYINNLIKNNNSSPESIVKALNNDKRLLYNNWKIEKTENNVIKKNYDVYTNTQTEENYDKMYILTDDSLGGKRTLKVYIGSNDAYKDSYKNYIKEHPTSTLSLEDFIELKKKK